MNIMELGAIGELVGGVAVIASLLYVGLQVRHSARATQAASRHAISDSHNQINLAICQNPQLARVLRDGNEDRSSLGEEEQIQYDTLWLAILHVFETLFYQSRLGAAERQLLVSEQRSIKAVFEIAGVRDWWAANPYSFSPEFRTYVESFFPSDRSAEGTSS